MVNALLSEDLPEDRFVTAVFGRLEPREHRLRYVSAGHGPMLHYQSATGRLFELPSQGCPIGVRPGVPFEPPWEVTFATGDLVVILTDGFTEWIDASGRMFGNERLERLIQRYHALPASDLIAALYRSVLDFAGGTPQLDDLTALVLKRVD